MALGPVAGGWLYDSFSTYSWLYIGSFGLGVFATLMALAFRPARNASLPEALA
jgi:MFS family permease